MAMSTAIVPTASGSRYLQQLCKHWAHKFTTEFDAARGWIDLGEMGTCEMTAAAGSLIVTASSPDETLNRLQEVIEVHIKRFAHREPDLAFDWRRPA